MNDCCKRLIESEEIKTSFKLEIEKIKRRSDSLEIIFRCLSDDLAGIRRKLYKINKPDLEKFMDDTSNSINYLNSATRRLYFVISGIILFMFIYIK